MIRERMVQVHTHLIYAVASGTSLIGEIAVRIHARDASPGSKPVIHRHSAGSRVCADGSRIVIASQKKTSEDRVTEAPGLYEVESQADRSESGFGTERITYDCAICSLGAGKCGCAIQENASADSDVHAYTSTDALRKAESEILSGAAVIAVGLVPIVSA